MGQGVLTLFLWLIPIALFGYVGFEISVATGRDPLSWLPSIQIWQVLVGFALAVVAVASFFSFRSHFRADEEAEWDPVDEPHTSQR